jgi:hypothetical protein
MSTITCTRSTRLAGVCTRSTRLAGVCTRSTRLAGVFKCYMYVYTSMNQQPNMCTERRLLFQGPNSGKQQGEEFERCELDNFHVGRHICYVLCSERFSIYHSVL